MSTPIRFALIGNPNYLTSYMVANALKYGAIGVIFYRPGQHGRYKGTISGTPRIPAVGISSEQGEALLAQIEAGNNIVSWSGTAAERTPYAYSINHITDGRINGGQVVLQEQKMQRIRASYHSQNDQRPIWTERMAMTNSTGEFYSTGSSQMVMTPVVRDEFVPSDVAKQAMSSEPFDQAKVDAIKQAIQDGQYPLDSRRIAESFMAVERMIE